MLSCISLDRILDRHQAFSASHIVRLCAYFVSLRKMCRTFLGLSITDNYIMFYVERDNIRFFVLDEADEMLSRGFKDQIYDIFQLLNNDIQVIIVK